MRITDLEPRHDFNVATLETVGDTVRGVTRLDAIEPIGRVPGESDIIPFLSSK
jgi:hypothetical protein